MNKRLEPCSQTSFYPRVPYRLQISTGLTGEPTANLLVNRNLQKPQILNGTSTVVGTFPEIYNASPLAVRLLIWTAGTGGIMTARSTAEALNRCYDPRIHIESSKVKQDDLRSPAQHLANIRDVFGINMSDLASILHVTRPTVYAWLSGQEPKEDAVRRIQQLSYTADKFDRANIIRLDKLVHRPVFNGRSLLDLLRSDEAPMEAIPALKVIADKEEKTRREPKGSGKHLRTLEDVSAESSIPIDYRSSL